MGVTTDLGLFAATVSFLGDTSDGWGRPDNWCSHKTPCLQGEHFPSVPLIGMEQGKWSSEGADGGGQKPYPGTGQQKGFKIGEWQDHTGNSGRHCHGPTVSIGMERWDWESPDLHPHFDGREREARGGGSRAAGR